MHGNGTGTTRVFGLWTAITVLAVFGGASGCKMGTAGTKPSWWTFGGPPKDDADALAAAPSFNGAVEKPSAIAKPYPTTSTPNGYVIDGAAKPGSAAVAAAAPAAVTYGVTAPPAKPDPVEMATAPAAARSADATGAVPPLASIEPQVGPYASLPADPAAVPGVAEPPPLQAIAGGAAPAAGVPGGASASFAPPAASQRMADARGSAAWPGQQTGVSAGSRYDLGSSSRFGGSAIDQPLPPPAAASVLPSALEPLPAAAPAAAAPSGGFPPPPSTPAPAAIPAAPTQTPRRPDPVYRPGGTSSYRPSRALLAAEPPATPGAVRTAGFDAPAADTP